MRLRKPHENDNFAKTTLLNFAKITLKRQTANSNIHNGTAFRKKVTTEHTYRPINEESGGMNFVSNKKK